MEYNIKLSIAYDYESPAVGGRHLVCLMPLDRAEGQSVAHAALKIEPSPAERLDRRDFFGNQITEFAFRGAQTRIALHMTARVTRSPAAPAPADPAASTCPVPRCWPAFAAAFPVALDPGSARPRDDRLCPRSDQSRPEHS
jgi:transglutaminase-like putative cysteine protease